MMHLCSFLVPNNFHSNNDVPVLFGLIKICTQTLATKTTRSQFWDLNVVVDHSVYFNQSCTSSCVKMHFLLLFKYRYPSGWNFFMPFHSYMSTTAVNNAFGITHYHDIVQMFRWLVVGALIFFSHWKFSSCAWWLPFSFVSCVSSVLLTLLLRLLY